MTLTFHYKKKKVNLRKKETKMFWSSPLFLKSYSGKSKINSLLSTLKKCLKGTGLRSLILWEMGFITADKSNWA